jgi:hypothetical protein
MAALFYLFRNNFNDIFAFFLNPLFLILTIHYVLTRI